jgi:hypothetical protein
MPQQPFNFQTLREYRAGVEHDGANGWLHEQQHLLLQVPVPGALHDAIAAHTPLCWSRYCVGGGDDDALLRVYTRDMVDDAPLLVPVDAYELTPRTWTLLAIAALLLLSGALMCCVFYHRRRRARNAEKMD